MNTVSNRVIAGIIVWGLSWQALALDLGNESMADKADRFDFEEFHKEKGITLWDDTPGKAVEPVQVAGSPSAAPAQVFEKGQILKIRQPYKLGNDPASRSVQSLFDATEQLHQQAYEYCPDGWIKQREWHQGMESRLYIHYEIVCL